MVTKADIAAIVTAGLATFTDSSVTVVYRAPDWQQTVTGLQHPDDVDTDSDLAGTIAGFRSSVRIILADCDDAELPPTTDDGIIIRTAAGVDTEYTVLSHRDIGGAVRVLTYGEDAA